MDKKWKKIDNKVPLICISGVKISNKIILLCIPGAMLSNKAILLCISRAKICNKITLLHNKIVFSVIKSLKQPGKRSFLHTTNSLRCR